MPKKKTVSKNAPKQRVLTAFIHDRSGSMSCTWKENLNGFKVFIDDLRKNKDVEYFLTLTAFDTLIDTVTVRPITEFNSKVLGKYPPRGGTALYDAIGQTLTDIDRLASDFDKIVVVIITDGEENSSVDWTKEKLNIAIDERLNRGNYTFQYLGCQPETWDDARKAGFTAGSTVVYNQANIGATYSTVANGLNNFANSRYKMTRSMTGNFADEDMVVSANLCVVKEDDDQPASR